VQIPGFNQMAAVQAGRVVELDPALFLQAQGPRIADAVEELLRLINEGSE
jgi:ABC-type hemin transport system substrate-binding protein